MDPSLPKHLMSSLAEHFRPIAATLGLEYFVEGIDEARDNKFQKDSLAFRMNGPSLYEGSEGTEWYGLEVHLLLTDIVQATTENSYNIYDWAGTLQKALQDPLPIYDFQPNPVDDILLGCLEPDKRVKNNIRVVNYQVVDKDARVRQMSVHGKFLLYC